MSESRPRLVHPLSWRSRHLRVFLLLGALLVAFRVTWGWHTHRLLQAQLDDLRRRGEPATLAELAPQDVPDAENAWTLQLQAATIAQGTRVWSPSNSNDEYRDFPPFPGYWMKRAAQSEAAHGQVFALARQARQRPRAQLRSGPITRPGINSILTPAFNQARHLANTLKDGALYSHVRGDDVEAVERVRDEMYVARSLQSDPILVSQLVGIGVGASATHAAQVIAPGLRLDKPGTRQAVRGLIADLLDESADWRGFAAGFYGERVVVDDFAEWSAHESWFVRPMADMEAVRRNRYYAALIAIAPTPNWPAASGAIDRIPGEQERANSAGAWMTSVRRPQVPRYSRFLMSEQWDMGLSRSFLTHFRHLADRRMTAVSLAAQLYRADHGGHWPARMEELAPAYLPAIPVDPYRADGGPLAYVMEKLPFPLTGERPLVYSADQDVPRGIFPEPMYGFQSTTGVTPLPLDHKKGQYRDLSRFEPPASPQAVNGDPSKPDAPGGEGEEDDGAKQP